MIEVTPRAREWILRQGGHITVYVRRVAG